MQTLILTNGIIFDGDTAHENLSVIIENGRVAKLAADGSVPSGAAVHDLDGRLLAPGLIDLQANGGGGVLFNDAPTLETLRRIGAAHRRFGTTGFLPTLISATPEKTDQAIDAVRQAIDAGVPGVLGIHLEGPFLDPEGRGIHDDTNFTAPDEDWFQRVTRPGHGQTLLTVAPETAGPDWIRRFTDAGVTVFGGHSAASYDDTRAALEAGLSGFTHLFNAMPPFSSRAPGMVGAALEDRDSYAGMICDGFHVHPASFAVTTRAKGPDRCVLVTDAMATVGGRQTEFEWNGQTVRETGGVCRLPDGSLAGSSLDMLTAVRNAMQFAGLDRFEALQMASLNPARAIGLDGELGRIRPGYRASFVELDETMTLQGCWIDGQHFEEESA